MLVPDLSRQSPQTSSSHELLATFALPIQRFGSARIEPLYSVHCMESPLTANNVLRIFRADEIRLFFAAASIALGLVIVGFSFVRQRFDRLMAPPSLLANKLQLVLSFFVAIPGFLFFGETEAAGRAGRVVVNAVCVS